MSMQNIILITRLFFPSFMVSWRLSCLIPLFHIPAWAQLFFGLLWIRQDHESSLDAWEWDGKLMLPPLHNGNQSGAKEQIGLCAGSGMQGEWVKGGKNWQSLNPTQSRAPRAFTLAEGVAEDDWGPEPPTRVMGSDLWSNNRIIIIIMTCWKQCQRGMQTWKVSRAWTKVKGDSNKW